MLDRSLARAMAMIWLLIRLGGGNVCGQARWLHCPHVGGWWCAGPLPSRPGETACWLVVFAGSCEDNPVSPPAPAVGPARLAQWCAEHLGSPPVDEIFRSGYLSAVSGIRLADGREVVVKVRPASLRIAACVEVQRRMFQAGYPCPEPLTGATPFDGAVATAEAYVPGGGILPSTDHAGQAFAEAFARLIRLAPRPEEVPALNPPPSWAAWNHAGSGLWPAPEDPDVNLTRRPARNGSTTPGAMPATGCELVDPKP
jgi:hypothetical protein